MTLGQVVDSKSSLEALINNNLPVKIAYKISKLINKINQELAIYEEERLKLVKKLGEETDKEKQEWKVKPENLDEFNKEMTKLVEIEVTLDFGIDKPLEKIPVSDLGEINIKPADLVNLDWLLE